MDKVIYRVEVTREDRVWIADVLDVPGAHTSARNLEALATRVQEVIGLVLDRPENERFDIEFEFVGVDAEFAAAALVGRERTELDRRQRELAARVSSSAQLLAQAGWSVRDIGGALHMTSGRVAQLLSGKAS